jgi:hypothetical protein
MNCMWYSSITLSNLTTALNPGVRATPLRSRKIQRNSALSLRRPSQAARPIARWSSAMRRRWPAEPVSWASSEEGSDPTRQLGGAGPGRVPLGRAARHTALAEARGERQWRLPRPPGPRRPPARPACRRAPALPPRSTPPIWPAGAATASCTSATVPPSPISPPHSPGWTAPSPVPKPHALRPRHCAARHRRPRPCPRASGPRCSPALPGQHRTPGISRPTPARPGPGSHGPAQAEDEDGRSCRLRWAHFVPEELDSPAAPLQIVDGGATADH